MAPDEVEGLDGGGVASTCQGHYTLSVLINSNG